MKICCFTGHRDIPQECLEKLGVALEGVLVKFLNAGVCEFRLGGAVGFDTVVALKLLELKSRYPEIKLHLYLPCRNQSQCWSKRDKDIYNYILSVADEVKFTSDTYWRGCMQKRNRALVDGADACVAYYTKETGGTHYTVKYAQACGVRVLNVAKMI